MKAGRIIDTRNACGLTVTDPRRAIKRARAQAECDVSLADMLARSLESAGTEVRNRDGRIIDRASGRFVK
jgi:hypothetical protein